MKKAEIQNLNQELMRAAAEEDIEKVREYVIRWC